MALPDIVSTLQLSIGPVILISGVGLLLLSMTNRMGRIIDRTRVFTQGLPGSSEDEHTLIIRQLRILWRRARLVRIAIAMAAISVLLAALLIITLFLGAFLNLAATVALATLFVLCMICLILSLLFFIEDINLSLKALWLEMPPEARKVELLPRIRFK